MIVGHEGASFLVMTNHSICVRLILDHFIALWEYLFIEYVLLYLDIVISDLTCQMSTIGGFNWSLHH